MAVKMKPVVTYRANASCPTHARTEIPVRDLHVVIDEPVERGGTNLGPTPTEAAMTALIACTNVIGNKNAHRLGIDLGEINIDAAVLSKHSITQREEHLVEMSNGW